MLFLEASLKIFMEKGFLLKRFERLRIPFPIKAEQVMRLNENKSFDYKEAVNNAVKYSRCSVITTTFEQLPGKQVSMTIADNGNGFDKAVIKPGNGLINMQERARQINGTLTISSASPGTAVTLVFPV